jgi:hypothetical protein
MRKVLQVWKKALPLQSLSRLKDPDELADIAQLARARDL